jgi:hypothetical protein
LGLCVFIGGLDRVAGNRNPPIRLAGWKKIR